MKRRFQIVLLLAPMLAAQPLPPLIDRELLFATPEITGAQLSPDGKYMAFVKPWKGTPNIWIKKTGDPMAAARPLTMETRHAISGYLWTGDGKFLCYVTDKNGDGNFNLYAEDPSAGTAPARDLTGLKGVTIQLYGAAPNDPDLVYIGINDRDRTWHDLYKVKVASAGKVLIRENTGQIASWFFDSAGRLRFAQRVAENGDQELLRVEPNTITKVYSCGAYETCTALRFDKDGKRVYVVTNKGATVNLAALTLLDPQTGKSETVESDPLRRVDFGTAVFSERTDDLAFTTYTDDRQRRYFKDKELEAEFKWMETKLPGKDLTVGSSTRDEQLWLVNAYGDTEPGETWLFDRQAHTLALQYKVQETLARGALASMQPIHYKSSDGLEISAYLTLPKGAPARNLPTLVIPHGGPWTRDVWGYNALAQLFANRGYAVLMPNYRGSTGYGKKFVDAANGEWGRKMQDDLTEGVQYLVARGTTDAKRVAILGSAYGGYAALAGAAFTPDLYRAAVDVFGPSNLLTMLDSVPPAWEALRQVMYARVANPGTPEGRAWTKERSPANEADKIKTPLMVVQGLRDAQVSRAETEQMVAGLRDRKVPVEYLLAGDEGHGFTHPVNHMAMLAAAEKFLAKYLEGRYQPEGTTEAGRRLAEITVDPGKLNAPKPAEEAALEVPKLVSDLKPGYYRYQTKVSMGGKEVGINTATIIEEKDGAWTATEIAETPAGTSIDSAVLEKGTLAVHKRSMKQGAATVDLEFSGGRATGKVVMNGQERNISADLGGPLFADAAGSLQSIGCLPLAEGFTMTYRNFDLQRQRTKVMRLRVTGSETVVVPAGSFEAFVVQIVGAESAGDQALIWIAKESRQPVKMVTVSAAMGGATVTAELAQQ